MKLTSSAFQSGQPIPDRYTADGENVSPPLHFEDVPGAAKSLALICDDRDAPKKVWVHWLIYNLPTDCRELPEHVSPAEVLSDGTGTKQGRNDFGEVGYGGPAPPPGKPHHYSFHLYALDSQPQLAAGATKEQLLASMSGHILDQCMLEGVYSR